MENSICICSFIKDEIEYLDEFLRYHIDLGIDHIFLYEDYSSQSHKAITDKYPDKVTLYSITQIIPNCILKDYVDNQKHRQPLYIRHGLHYIKSHFDYGWFLVIDIDEYLTLNNVDLKELLDRYTDYEAIRIPWQNYNANGHIYKPDYSKKSLMETYTQPCEFAKSDMFFEKPNDGIYKIAYNSKNFTMFNVIDICMANPYLRILNNPVGIYLKHYITKSWEEYVWKLKTRGMFNPEHRGFDDFFDMNPDLLPRKSELLKIAENIIVDK